MAPGGENWHYIKSIAIPPLGSGLGGLNWYQVKCLIEEALGTLQDIILQAFEL